MNETLNILDKRRSVRSFLEKEITPEDAKAIKIATLRAPTAGNMTLYSVIEVTDQKEKETLATLCDDQPMIAKAPMVWIFLADMQKWVNYFQEGGSKAKGEQKNLAAWRNPGLGDLHLCLQDAIIAAQTSVIAAESLGIGSCYIGDILENFEQVKTVLNLSSYTIPACMVVFGYKKNQQEIKLTPRCLEESIFMENQYQELHLDQLEAAFSPLEKQRRATNSLPFDNTGSIADYYYFKKHTSDFMEEMNRSTAVMFDHWTKA
ncbi:nitroreductase family protein [uncultured Sphaerochaeta sp.]|uniref:nitroreductase family protein n=1 Tax=uncultured Sphaerochaeta sp. TaxID=886478 RepID=UPI002A0A1939|nr:nitroreductase family protein [uncultured Sphaerochaeta sp.]